MRKLTKKQEVYAEGIAQGRFDCTMDNHQQLDCIEKNTSDIRRMLRWLIAEQIHTDKDVVDEMRLKAVCNQPDIMDILEEKDERDKV